VLNNNRINFYRGYFFWDTLYKDSDISKFHFENHGHGTKLLHYVYVIKIDNDFNHRNFDRVSEPLKFRRYLYFRQVVRSSNCPFGKMSVRQNVCLAKRPFCKMSVRQNVFRQKVFRQSVFRQNVRPPKWRAISNLFSFFIHPVYISHQFAQFTRHYDIRKRS
jgi:hypothetical protein